MTDSPDHRALLEAAIGMAPVVLWRIDADGVFELSEGGGLAGIGLEPGEAVGQSVFEMFAEDPEAMELVRRALAGEELQERTAAAGRIFENRLVPVREGGEVIGAVGVSIDITERARETDRAEFHSQLLNAVGQAVIATDADGYVIYWNRTAEELYGWSRDEAVGRPVTELTVPEPSYDSAAEIIEALRQGQRWTGEYTVQRKDGSTFPALVTNVPVLQDGELVAMIGVSADLTEQKELEAQLRQAQKMEAVGQLAGGVAHDFNNLLTAIGGYVSLAAEQSDDDQVRTDLNEVQSAIDRARALTDKLLAFSRRGAPRTESVDLNSMLTELAGMLRRMVGEQIRLQVDTARRPWPVAADRPMLEQAIVNLAVNARAAMPEGGTLTLATQRVTLDAARVRDLELDVVPGDYMRLTVTDTGVGIDPEIQDRIFDPFFTTRQVGEGSGLGLSMVFGAVKQAGGAVTVDSAPGEGARFTLYLPRTEADEQATTERVEDEASTAAGMVLVVEDEPAVLSLATRVLKREGYRVLEAATGKEARDRIEEEPGVDLVVTDVIMPQVTGPELIQELRLTHPRIRSLFMSGYAADELESRGLSRDSEHFLPKPFTPAELIDAVRGALQD